MRLPEPVARWQSALSRLHIAALRCRPARCPYCGPTLLLRWAANEHAVRCLRCRGGAVHLSLGRVLLGLQRPLRGLRVLELSSRGALVRFLRRSGTRLTTSEFLDGVEPGSEQAGVRCEDVQRLSFADASFDLVTHTDVFEHVESDAAGFRELRRVLAPDGATVFSVPLDPAAATVERVVREHGALRFLHPPEYHGDRLRGPGAVLSWRDYGGDIVQRLRAAGFGDAWLEYPGTSAWFGHGRLIVVATCQPRAQGT